MDLSKLKTEDPEVIRQLTRFIDELKESEVKIGNLQSRVDQLGEKLAEYEQKQTWQQFQAGSNCGKVPAGLLQVVTKALVGNRNSSFFN